MPEIWVSSQGGIRVVEMGYRKRLKHYIHRPSLGRGVGMAVFSLVISLTLYRWTEHQASAWLILPIPLCLAAIPDTARCMRKKWDLYHGGVLLFLYAELLLLVLEATLAILPLLFASAR